MAAVIRLTRRLPRPCPGVTANLAHSGNPNGRRTPPQRLYCGFLPSAAPLTFFPPTAVIRTCGSSVLVVWWIGGRRFMRRGWRMEPEMGPRQIFDDLTAHIALFHSSARPYPSSSYPRKAILRWFSSLSVHQRQACLTVVDSDFVKILLQMLARLQNDGHCHFFILPDLPSTPGSSLPSLCYRLSGGLLSRASAANESERFISSSVRLFGSQEGELGTEYALDSMTISEDLLQDPEKFVMAMDEISSGGFLRENDLNTSQSSWVEFEWLKAKGYYSIESFLANKLELALRMSWLECHGGKKPRAGKSRARVGTAGIAANVFWRQKGCLDWWLGLGPGVRKKIILLFLCKGAKTLVLCKCISLM